jgi:hypothetical protein
MPFDAATEVMPLSSLDCLREARRGVARPCAWNKHSYGSDGRHCAIGWLMEARDEGDCPVWHRIDTVACYLYPALPWRWRIATSVAGKFGVVIMFNDVPWRRQRAVVRLFDRAIARLA